MTQTVSNQIDLILTMAYSLRAESFGHVGKALQSGAHRLLTQHMTRAISSQYMGADVGAIIRRTKEMGIDPAAADASERMAAIAKDHMPPIKDTADMPGIHRAMVDVSKHGRMEVEQQATAGRRYMPNVTRLDVDSASSQDLQTRVGQLFVRAHGMGKRDRQPLTDQRLQETLDPQSHRDVADMVRMGMMKHPKNDHSAADHARNQMAGMAKHRGMMTANHEGMRAYNIGFRRSALAMEATHKTWHMGAGDGACKHTEQMGQRCAVHEAHMDGSMWAGETEGCRCGISLAWDSPEKDREN